jgi:hypothetical protein
MVLRILTKMMAVTLAAVLVVSASPFSLAATADIGVIATAGGVTVNQNQAPTGTTVFSNDKVEAVKTPTVINLKSGGRIEMTKAAVTFAMEDDTLVVRPSHGVFRFNFLKDEKVRIDTKCYDLFSGQDNAIGALELNGQEFDVALASGSLTYDANGEKFSTTPDNPFHVSDRGNDCVVDAALSKKRKLAAILIGAGVAGAAIGIGVAVSGDDEKSPSSR